MKYLIKSLIENYRNKMTAKLALGFIMFLYIPIPLYSQVTVKEFEPKVESLVQKPVPYDSLKNLEYQKNFNDYKQYIGLQLFLPEYDNKQIILYSNRLNKQSNITTKVYKPFIYNPNKQWSKQNICSNSKEIGNRYYTILDVLSIEQFWRIINTMNTNLRQAYTREKQSSQTKSKDKVETVETRRRNGENMGDSYAKNSGIKVDYFDDFDDEIKYHDDIRDKTFMIRDNINKDTAYLTDGYCFRFFLVPYFMKMKQCISPLITQT